MKLHLGCGSDVKSGFINIDMSSPDPNVLVHDLTKGLPGMVRDIEYVYSSHFFEHLTPSQMVSLLREILSNMVVGAKIRFCLPDFKKTALAYINNDLDFFNVPEVMHFCPNGMILEAVQYSVYQYGEHKQVMDAGYLEFLLKDLGFSSASEVEFDPSIDQDSPLRRRFSFYLEATK